MVIYRSHSIYNVSQTCTDLDLEICFLIYKTCTGYHRSSVTLQEFIASWLISISFRGAFSQGHRSFQTAHVGTTTESFSN